MAVGDTNRYLFKVTDNNKKKIVEQAEGELVATYNPVDESTKDYAHFFRFEDIILRKIRKIT